MAHDLSPCANLDDDGLLRRRMLGLALASPLAVVSGTAAAGNVPPRADSPRVGVDPLFVRNGLTQRWQAAMGRDLGWQAQWQAAATAEVLSQLEAGQVDAGLFLSTPQADDLDRQGLIYYRQTIATAPVSLLGPPDDVAGIRGEKDPARALRQVLLAAQAGAANWVQPPAGSPMAGLMTQLLAGNAPQLDKHPKPARDNSPAYELVPRPAQQAGDRRKIWLQDERLQLQAQVACSFRSRHPGSKLLVTWLGWPVAQAAFRQVPGNWQGRPSNPAAGRRP